MNKKTSSFIAATLCLAASLITGCASLGDGRAGIGGDAGTENLRHTVAPGDRLSDIALTYTGEMSRWEAIAQHNDITNPRTLRVGDVIEIPAALLPSHDETQKTPTNTDLQKTPTNSERQIASTQSLNAASDSAQEKQLAPTATGTLAVQRSRNAAPSNVELAEVVVEPVTRNRTFDMTPIEASSLDLDQASNDAAPQVRVIGTYYPKGVYQQPASYSTLIMRVAPGTVFELEREINDWYKILTDQGVGYLRMVDGQLVPEEG